MAVRTGAMFNGLIFGGVDSRDYGIYITGEAVYNAPERAVEMVSVPGRNGELTIDQGHWTNIQVEYPAGTFADDQAGFRAAISDFRNAILSQIGYQRLEDTYHPDEYRMAIYKDGLEVEPVQCGSAGEFTIRFNCKPQRWLTSGEAETAIANGGSITNPTLCASQPLIKVTGDGTLTVGSHTIVISSGATNPIYIDCELMEAYEINSQDDVINRNNLVLYGGLAFPELDPGANTITWSGNISAVAITPRWWRL